MIKVVLYPTRQTTTYDIDIRGNMKNSTRTHYLGLRLYGANAKFGLCTTLYLLNKTKPNPKFD